MKIAIAGYGVEGKSSYNYWQNDPKNEVTIVDQNIDLAPANELPSGAQTILGPDAFGQLNSFDLVIRTPGLAPYKIVTDGQVWSATNEFFKVCPAPIIGVTGSKGKGTTASLITSILEAAGKKVWLLGNIGQPALDTLESISSEDIVVYELSSFQLWDIEASPHIAVVLFIEQEHLDVHRSMEEYVEAKARIVRYQTAQDCVIYNGLNKYATQIAERSKAQKIAYPSDNSAHIKNGNFYYGTQKICSTSALQIKGEHNLENALAAIDAVWEYTKDVTAIEAGLRTFKGLPHRLEFIKNVAGVDYYDDSIATTPASAIAALRAFADRPRVIILGGSSKGSDFSELASELAKNSVYALLIGDEAQTIASACDIAGFSDYEIIDNSPAHTKSTNQPIAEVFTRRAAEIAKPGSVVLLSPASASFGLFKNYADRGDQFTKAVCSL